MNEKELAKGTLNVENDKLQIAKFKNERKKFDNLIKEDEESSSSKSDQKYVNVDFRTFKKPIVSKGLFNSMP